MIATSLPLGVAEAGMISTKQIIKTEITADQASPRDQHALDARERVHAILKRDDVRAEMVALGVDPEEARARVAAMTDSEIQHIAGRLDELPAGGLSVGTAIVVLFVVFGVTVILDAFGLLNLYPFVCSPGECGRQYAVAPNPTTFPEPAAGGDYLYQEDRAPAYRPDRRRDWDDPYARRRQPRYQTEQYYEPAPIPSTRNYYEERFGTPRQIR